LKAEAGVPILLSVCLVNFNDAANLPACLESVEADTHGIPHEIIVADNASTDGSAELVERKYPRVKILRGSGNVGFGRANNAAVRESGGEFVLFLNTDVIVRPGTIPRLLKEMKDDPRTGAAGPALINPGGAHQVSFGGRLNFTTEALLKSWVNRATARSLRADRRRREVFWVSGAFLLARREAFDAAGGFDPEYFLYFEDIDLCAAIRERGWNVVFLPEAQSFHRGGATTAGTGLRSRLEYRRSQVRFYGKHNSAVSRALLGLYLRLSFAGLSLKGSFRNEPAELRRGFRDLWKRKRT
jgi:GT2 family glycosyltransferase